MVAQCEDCTIDCQGKSVLVKRADGKGYDNYCLREIAEGAVGEPAVAEAPGFSSVSVFPQNLKTLPNEFLQQAPLEKGKGLNHETIVGEN